MRLTPSAYLKSTGAVVFCLVFDTLLIGFDNVILERKT